MTNYLVWLLVVIAATALVIAVESAISKVSQARLVELELDDDPRYAALMKVLADKPKHINALQILSAVGWAASVVLMLRVLNKASTALSTDATTIIVMSVVGFVIYGVGAKTIGKQKAEALGRLAAPFVRLLARLLNPIARVLIVLGNAITPGKGFNEGPFASTAELREMVNLAGGEVLEDDERRMIHSVFELGDTVAREVMVPRTEMVWIERHKTLRQAMSLSLRSGYSRIPVVGEDVDDIVGVIYIKDVARRIFEHSESQSSERVESLMRSVLMAPDSKRVDILLREMQQKRTHIVVLIDEYGGTAGLVAMEDIVEEIVGEISDEYDTAADEVVQLSESAFRVSARLHIEDLGDIVGVELDPEEEGVDTVAGLLAARLGRVAIPGSRIELNGWNVTAESVAGRRNKVGSVLVERVVEDEEISDGSQ
jgi:CBS domain containing-hemolysin-like protein